MLFWLPASVVPHHCMFYPTLPTNFHVENHPQLHHHNHHQCKNEDVLCQFVAGHVQEQIQSSWKNVWNTWRWGTWAQRGDRPWRTNLTMSAKCPRTPARFGHCSILWSRRPTWPHKGHISSASLAYVALQNSLWKPFTIYTRRIFFWDSPSLGKLERIRGISIYWSWIPLRCAHWLIGKSFQPTWICPPAWQFKNVCHGLLVQSRAQLWWCISYVMRRLRARDVVAKCLSTSNMFCCQYCFNVAIKHNQLQFCIQCGKLHGSCNSIPTVGPELLWSDKDQMKLLNWRIGAEAESNAAAHQHPRWQCLGRMHSCKTSGVVLSGVLLPAPWWQHNQNRGELNWTNDE